MNDGGINNNNNLNFLFQNYNALTNETTKEKRKIEVDDKQSNKKLKQGTENLYKRKIEAIDQNLPKEQKIKHLKITKTDNNLQLQQHLLDDNAMIPRSIELISFLFAGIILRSFESLIDDK